jgi:hypothetical protein
VDVVLAAEEDGEVMTATGAAEDNNPLISSLTIHNTAWYQDDLATQVGVNGPVMRQDWRIRNASGNLLGPRLDDWRQGRNDPELQMSRLEYFLLMFPPSHLQDMARMTNKCLSKVKKEMIAVGEVLKFLGVLIPASRFEFQTKRSL